MIVRQSIDRFGALLYEGRGAVSVYGELAFSYAHRLTRLLDPADYRATFRECLALVRRPFELSCDEFELVIECAAA